MQLKINSWHSRLYRWFYGIEKYSKYNQPRDFCTYFKKLMFAILLSPFALVTSLVATVIEGHWFTYQVTPEKDSLYDDELVDNGLQPPEVGISYVGMFILAVILLFCLVSVIAGWIFIFKFGFDELVQLKTSDVWYSFLPIGFTAGMIGIILAGSIFLAENYKKIKTINSNNIFYAWFKSVKDKYCPIITWNYD